MLTVIGVDGGPLPPGAVEALAGAEVVTGAARYLHLAPATAERVEMGPVDAALGKLTGRRGVVLASGDPGFFGIVRLLRARGFAPVVLPACSAVQRAFARIGRPWDDVAVVSAHGRALGPAVNVCRAHPAVAVLTAPGAGPAEIGAALHGWERMLVVAEDLDGPDERVTTVTPAQAAARAWRDPNVVLCLRDPDAVPDAGWIAGGARPGGGPRPDGSPPGGPKSGEPGSGEPGSGEPGSGEPGSGRPGSGGPTSGGSAPDDSTSGGPMPGGPAGPGRAQSPGGWALPESAFTHRAGMITKAEVRALALARLAPAPGQLIWDVGAGSGSVAVECARLGAAVIAIERRPDDVERIRANAAAHGVDVRVVQGEAPGALAGLPQPDAVFVGGGGPGVVEAVAGVPRVVVALAALDRLAPTRHALRHHRVEGVQLAASRLAELPDGTVRLAATNPIILLWGEIT